MTSLESERQLETKDVGRSTDPKTAALAVGPPRPSLLQFASAEVANDTDERKLALSAKKKKPVGKKAQVLDVLQSLLPPREYLGADGMHLVQHVSTAPSSREEVIDLQMRLDEELQRRQARESGICPVREELYAQCFDELIRQITIESPERGLLQLRVRDEVRMTIAAYQTLYQSSITFGMRKSLQAEQGNAALLGKIEQLEADKKRLQAQVQDARALYDAIEKRISEQRATEDKRMQEEKDFLKFQTAHLEQSLKSFLQ